MSQRQHIASAAVMRVLEGIQPLFPNWPAVLPTPNNRELRPFAIGIHADLLARMTVPEGMAHDEAAERVQAALGFLVQSFAYRRAVAEPGAMRFNIDGNPVEPVTPAQAAYSLSKLPKSTNHKVAVDEKETRVFDLPIKSMKVVVPLSPDMIPRKVSETDKFVEWRLKLPDGNIVTAQFSGRNYRKALRTLAEIEATGNMAIVLLQGRLTGQQIEGAGITVQPRDRKDGEQ
jgi:hypothetical protein